MKFSCDAAISRIPAPHLLKQGQLQLLVLAFVTRTGNPQLVYCICAEGSTFRCFSGFRMRPRIHLNALRSRPRNQNTINVPLSDDLRCFSQISFYRPTPCVVASSHPIHSCVFLAVERLERRRRERAARAARLTGGPVGIAACPCFRPVLCHFPSIVSFRKR